MERDTVRAELVAVAVRAERAWIMDTRASKNDDDGATYRAWCAALKAINAFDDCYLGR